MTDFAGHCRSITTALAGYGLILRGGFNFEASEAAPPGSTGRPAKSVLLVGHAGGSYWPHFRSWQERQPPQVRDPLDSWSRAVIGAIAEQFRARAVSPSDRPWLPFQQWAMRAEGLKPSPLGILMHPEYGLWHAYRGALLCDEVIPIQAFGAPSHLCDACLEKPCLNACPVQAYSLAGFASDACRTHVRGEGGTACRDSGCFDRNACPYGAAYRYPARVQAFHMASFAPMTAA